MEAVSALKLDQQICFKVYKLHRLITARYRPLLDDLGLTYPQYLVMLVLWEQDGISLGELGKRLDLDSGTLSPLLKRLQVIGLLERSRDPSDERSLVIRLSALGQGLRAKAEKVPAALMGCLVGDPEDYAAFATILDEVIGAVGSC